MIELLSPAGDKQSFIAAVQSGADAVYMGLDRFNARIMCENFSIDDYIWCLDYAHIYGVKVYLTLNVLFRTEEVKEALDLVCTLYNHGLDAVILQDIGMARVINKSIPDLPLHASTQMTAHNLKQVNFLESLGFKRVVLARELTLDEIDHIAKNTNVQLEVFIHGALCVSYSGQCLMSYMIGKRSANGGKCGGTCRLNYKLYENGKYIKEGHLLSKKDIFGASYVKKLQNMGIASLKIEGRGKSKEYVSVITRKYRKCIDAGKIDANDEKEMLQMFNRSSKSSGYFEGVLSTDSISYKKAKNTGLYLGEVLDIEKKMIKIKLEEDISMHDGVEILDSKRDVSTIVTCIKDKEKNIVNSDTKKGNVVWIGDFKNLPKIGDKIVKTTSSKLIDKTSEFLSKIRRKIDVNVDISVISDKKIEAKIYIGGNEKTLQFDYIPQKAITRAVCYDDIKEAMDKTSDTYYNLILKDVILDRWLFVPKTVLNDIRRKIVDYLIESSKVRKNVKVNFKEEKINENKEKTKPKKSLQIYNFDSNRLKDYADEKADIIYIDIFDIMKYSTQILNDIKGDIYIYIPNIILDSFERNIDENLEDVIKEGKVKGILLGNIGYLETAKNLKEKYKLKLVIDYSLNVTNIYSAKFFKSYLADMATLSPEVEKSEANSISKIIDTETLDGCMCIMTSRFCVIKAFSGGCNCSHNRYVLEDSYKNKYFVVPDNTQCITRLFREYRDNIKSCANISAVRDVII